MVHSPLTLLIPILGIFSLVTFLAVFLLSKPVFKDPQRLHKPFLLTLFSMLLLDMAYFFHTMGMAEVYKILEFAVAVGFIAAIWIVLKKTASIFILSEINKKLESEVQAKTAKLNDQVRVASTLQFSQSRREVFENLSKILAQIVSAEKAVITLYYPEEGILRAESPGYNVPEDMINDWIVELRGDKPGVEIFKNNSYYISNDTLNDSRLDQPFMKKYGLYNTINVSFQSQNQKAVGNLVVFNKPGGFTDEDAERLSMVGPQLGATIENLVLQDKMRENHKTLELAYRQLRDVDRLKTDIISNVSHELKTPITVIRGSLDIILDSDDLGEIRELAHLSKQKLLHQLEIVENLICFSMQQKDMDRGLFEKFSLKELLDEIINELTPYYQPQKIRLDMSVPKGILMFANKKRIKRALKNILDNAIKFNVAGGELQVKAFFNKRYVEIKVSDTGIGIPLEHKDRIFEPLFQCDPSTNRSYGGTGMGLTAAKSCIEDHGGDIMIESTPGKGTIVTAKIPVD